jgi:hypothetical protein
MAKVTAILVKDILQKKSRKRRFGPISAEKTVTAFGFANIIDSHFANRSAEDDEDT